MGLKGTYNCRVLISFFPSSHLIPSYSSPFASWGLSSRVLLSSVCAHKNVYANPLLQNKCPSVARTSPPSPGASSYFSGMQRGTDRRGAHMRKERSCEVASSPTTTRHRCQNTSPSTFSALPKIKARGRTRVFNPFDCPLLWLKDKCLPLKKQKIYKGRKFIYL